MAALMTGKPSVIAAELRFEHRYIYLDSCNFAIAALINSFWLQFLQQQQLHFLSQLQLNQEN